MLNEAMGAKWAAREREGIEFLPGLSAAGSKEINLTGNLAPGKYFVVIDNTPFGVSVMPAHGQPGPAKVRVTITLREE